MQPSERNKLVRQFFGDRGLNISDDTNLFECGAIDSMGIIELVVFIEEKFGVSLEAEKMTAENFSTVDAILSLVERIDV